MGAAGAAITNAFFDATGDRLGFDVVGNLGRIAAEHQRQPFAPQQSSQGFTKRVRVVGGDLAQISHHLILVSQQRCRCKDFIRLHQVRRALFPRPGHRPRAERRRYMSRRVG